MSKQKKKAAAQPNRNKKMTGKIDALVGKRLRSQREFHKLSRKKLGKIVDVSWQQIHKYETGLNRISASRLMKLATFFHVPMTYYFDGIMREKDKIYDDLGNSILSRSETSDLIYAYSRIPNIKVRNKILKLIRSLAKATESE